MQDCFILLDIACAGLHACIALLVVIKGAFFAGRSCVCLFSAMVVTFDSLVQLHDTSKC